MSLYITDRVSMLRRFSKRVANSFHKVNGYGGGAVSFSARRTVIFLWMPSGRVSDKTAHLFERWRVVALF